MMAANYSNKQNLENHGLLLALWFCQLWGSWPGPTLQPASCIHLSQTLKLCIVHIKAPIWPQQLFSSSLAQSTRSTAEAPPAPYCPADPVGWGPALPTSVGYSLPVIRSGGNRGM